MGDLAAAHEAQLPAAPAAQTAVARRPVDPLSGELTACGVVTLQRLIGNRAIGRVLARQAKPLADRVADVKQTLEQAKGSPAAADLSAATKVGKEAWTATAALIKAGKADSEIDAARELVKTVVKALWFGGGRDQAVQVAAVADAPVKQWILNNITVTGVGGQQRSLKIYGGLTGESVSAVGDKQTSADWLQKNTDAAGAAFKKLEAAGVKGTKGLPLTLELVQDLLTQYFTVSPTDVTPDTMGKVGGVAVDATSDQLLVDCDVWASYGARVLRAAGWNTVGYMAIVPAASEIDSSGTPRSAHAVALAKRAKATGGADYVAVSDYMLKQVTAASDQAALDGLLDHGLEIYADKGRLKAYKSYYLAAGTGGAFDMKLVDPENKKVPVHKQVPAAATPAAAPAPGKTGMIDGGGDSAEV